MIISFKHKGLERFYRTGNTAGISRILARLDSAETPADMNIAGWQLHPLKGDLLQHWSVSVNSNWRITFKLTNGNAEIVDYQDYH